MRSQTAALREARSQTRDSQTAALREVRQDRLRLPDKLHSHFQSDLTPLNLSLLASQVEFLRKSQ
ncbi:MAG: hypothetical protein NWR72_12230 [Bacteroidia bacterium]|nr:hypothetical protein [Bacteroidia bacterium]